MNLDCTGMRCPQPVITLARTVRTLGTGSVIRITTDDPAAAIDIPAWCRMRRHRCEVIADAAGQLTHSVILGG